jgi:omega-hydroxy-beta-dihydromenaquinone-9 sulfotransferase
VPRSNWHRVFHPLCGADLMTLLRLIAQHGPPSTAGSLRLGIALASSIGRMPFTLAERAWTALGQHPPGPAPPPIFIVGHMRSGTTHLHNLLAASGQFATVPPVLAGMPWEALGLARVLRPFVEQYLPEDRLIDSVRVRSDSPTEAYLHSIHDYSKLTYTFSKESVGRVTERWQPFVTRFGYHPPDLERCAP